MILVKGNRADHGFSLVELMIVVAIVGILSSLSIQSFQVFKQRAASAEAKIALSAIFSAQKAYFGEFSMYTPCLENAGYSPSGDIRRFRVGFSQAGVGGPTPLDTATGKACSVTSGAFDAGGFATTATTLFPGATVLPSDSIMPALAGPSSGAFTAVAATGTVTFYAKNLDQDQNLIQIAQESVLDTIKATDWSLVARANADKDSKSEKDDDKGGGRESGDSDHGRDGDDHHGSNDDRGDGDDHNGGKGSGSSSCPSGYTSKSFTVSNAVVAMDNFKKLSLIQPGMTYTTCVASAQ